MREHKSLIILMVCVGYLVSGLVFIPFTVGAVSAYNAGMANSSSFVQLGAIMTVLVAVPIILALCVWKGYRFAWGLAIAFAAFNVFLYLVIFSSLRITLSNGPLVSNSIIGPLGYAIGYGITYLGTYLFAIIEIALNLGLIFLFTRKRIKDYFGL